MTEWLYGTHSVREALRAGRRRAHRLLIEVRGDGRKRDVPPQIADLEALARRAGVRVEWAPSAQLDAVTRAGRHHQGMALEVGPFQYATLDGALALCRQAGEHAMALLLDSLQDPQNFGTLLRTSEAVGVTAVLMLDRRQVEVTPAVVNASAGAVEHLNVCLVNNLARAVEALQDLGLWVYALDAGEGATTYTAADLRGPLGLVVGSEGRGVGRLVRERCDGALAIPMLGKVESLNAAVAGSVVLYEALRQQTATG